MDVVGGVAFVDLSVIRDDAVHLSEVGGGISGHVAAVGFTMFVPHQGQCAWYSFFVEVVALCADNRLLVPLEVEMRQVRIEGAVGFEIYDLHIVDFDDSERGGGRASFLSSGALRCPASAPMGCGRPHVLEREGADVPGVLIPSGASRSSPSAPCVWSGCGKCGRTSDAF